MQLSTMQFVELRIVEIAITKNGAVVPFFVWRMLFTLYTSSPKVDTISYVE